MSGANSRCCSNAEKAQGQDKVKQSVAWKQPKCPSSDEWIKKMWHIYTMEYYSAIKRNEMEVSVVR